MAIMSNEKKTACTVKTIACCLHEDGPLINAPEISVLTVATIQIVKTVKNSFKNIVDSFAI